MHQPQPTPHATRLFGLLIIITTALCCSTFVPNLARARASGAQASGIAAAPQANGQFQVYLPAIVAPWTSPFGVQSEIALTPGALLTRTLELHAGWARVGPISWQALQPNEGDPINWALLADFENELRTLHAVGITPEVVVIYSPRWATINTPFPTSCGAIRSDKFAAFAAFMRALVERYKTPEFGLHHWELGNEVDVDPRLVQPDNGFGCWGDISDPFYGGRHYGEMLKVVTPAIRAADSSAQVWVGGLLLASPNTTDPGFGKPELFLAGVLEAGAAPYFDVVPYHWYPSYGGRKIDYDYGAGNEWDSWGGGVVGKARYLRELMRDYGVDKPLFLNEISFTCPNDYLGSYPWCQSPDSQFYELQGSMLIRTLVRGQAEGVVGFIWYTINGPGWRYGGLLDADANPKLVYRAYQELASHLQDSSYVEPARYAVGVEGYVFRKGSLQVEVVWAEQDQTLPITIPQSRFVGAFNRYGNPIAPIDRGTDYQLLIQFEPIYIVERP